MLRVAVLASGGGTNLQSLIDARSRYGSYDIVGVLSNRPGAGALDRARAAGIPGEVIPDPGAGAAMVGQLESFGTTFVVLAGYLKLIPPEVVRRWAGSMINIHPALLPAFGGAGMYGVNVHRAVLASGASVSGPTVHLVSDEYDRGRILAQWPVPVLDSDTAESLQERVLEMEHRLLPLVVHHAALAGRAVRLTPTRGAWRGAEMPGEIELRSTGA